MTMSRHLLLLVGLGTALRGEGIAGIAGYILLRQHNAGVFVQELL